MEEGGSEDEEMTEERVMAILSQVQQAEKDVCSVSGWHADKTADGTQQPPSPGTERVTSHGGSSDSAADKAEAQTDRQTDSSTAGPSGGDKDTEEEGHQSQHKVQS